jgi:hypothetical protein
MCDSLIESLLKCHNDRESKDWLHITSLLSEYLESPAFQSSGGIFTDVQFTKTTSILCTKLENLVADKESVLLTISVLDTLRILFRQRIKLEMKLVQRLCLCLLQLTCTDTVFDCKKSSIRCLTNLVFENSRNAEIFCSDSVKGTYLFAKYLSFGSLDRLECETIHASVSNEINELHFMVVKLIFMMVCQRLVAQICHMFYCPYFYYSC